MNSLESAFVPYQPQPKACGEKQSFFFVTYTGDPVSKNKAARKTIRAQASRASASQRIETTAARRTAKQRSQSASPTKRNRVSTPKAKRLLLDYAAELSPTSPLRSHTAFHLAVQPQSPLEAAAAAAPADWECGIPTLIRENFVKAVLEMRRKQIGCDLRTLSSQFAEPSLYQDPLMLQCLELLAVTNLNVAGSRPSVSRAVSTWLWHRLFFAVQSALSGMTEVPWSVGPVLVLLAGWELAWGEAVTCEMHLRTLSRLMYGSCDSHHSPTSLPEAAYVFCLPATPDYMTPTPLGFRFFQSQQLLPACLMDAVGGFGHCDPYSPRYLTDIRRIGLAAMSCQPSSPGAIQSLRLNDINARVAVHVRLASALLSAMAQVDMAAVPPVMDPSQATTDAMAVWYPETLTLDSEALMGTVYDEILLWTLCVFCCAAMNLQTHLPPAQRPMVVRLLKSQGVNSWARLGELLARYVWTDNLAFRLQMVLGNDVLV